MRYLARARTCLKRRHYDRSRQHWPTVELPSLPVPMCKRTYRDSMGIGRDRSIFCPELSEDCCARRTSNSGVAAVTQDDWDGLFSICLPDPAPPTKRAVMIDQDGKGITLSSLNPNLRVLSLVVQQAEMANPGVGTMSVTIFGFIAKHYASFMQVVA